MNVQYIAENGDSAWFNKANPKFSDYADNAEKVAMDYFNNNPDNTHFKIAVIDFETNQHCILEFEFHRRLEITEF